MDVIEKSTNVNTWVMIGNTFDTTTDALCEIICREVASFGKHLSMYYILPRKPLFSQCKLSFSSYD